MDGLTEGVVYSRMATRSYGDGANDPIDLEHRGKYALENGTISLSFSLDNLFGSYALISKDGRENNDGDLTVWVQNGVLKVRMQDGSNEKWMTVPIVLEEETTYQFAMTFGEGGLGVWVNGEMLAAEPTFKADLTANTQNLVIGGTKAWRSNQDDDPHDVFDGDIGHVQIFDQALGGQEMIQLASNVDMMLGHHAMHHATMADLMPVFEQMHHGSDTLKDMFSDYGVSHHGHIMRDLTLWTGTDGDDDEDGTNADDAKLGGAGNDSIHSRDGDDIVQGGTGNDMIWGGAGNDILDGGEGEDRLYGGAGNDILIARGDGREGAVAYDPDRDEGDPYNELTNGKLYPDQPVPADDFLKGGTGADIFYFQTLINAKARYIEKHTRDDGTINWHGVAGENDNIHDHWVDVLGDDILADFNRAEGDRIVIEGHTTEIRYITYGDADKNGVLDHSVISLYSDQGGGGGAHNQDELGTITVYGDLVKLSDIEHSAAPAYGIVATAEDIAEALAPTEVAEDIRQGRPSPLAESEGPVLPSGATPIMEIVDQANLSGEEGDYLNVGHAKALELENGTISLSFTLDQLFGKYALVSKDARGREDGEFTVFVENGVLTIAMENDEGKTEWLSIPEVLSAGQTYQFALTFGDDGIQLWLDGEMRAAEPTFKANLTDNESNLVIGASRAWRSDQNDEAHDRFEGDISDVLIFDTALEGADMIALAKNTDMMKGHHAEHHAAMSDLMPIFDQLHHGSETLKEMLMDYGVSHHGHVMHEMDMMMGGADENNLRGKGGMQGINGGAGDDNVHGRGGNDMLQGGTGNDVVKGGGGNDILDGGEGEDKLLGGKGNDLLIARGDGREGEVAFDADRDEGDPYNELTNGKLYPDQPVAAGDYLVGGKGADIFYFQTLINAKQRYIEKHTRDDGTINWHGVAGENDNIHDHWVDVQGHDIVADFSRAEGDRLVIEGHTTEIRDIVYGDADGNGTLDHSIIYLYSEQGRNGGAHNQDDLGTITVYGDLVKESDIEHTAAPAYGIVATSEDMDEAITPSEVSEDINFSAPKSLPGLAKAANGRKAAFSAQGDFEFDSDERSALIFDHTDAMDVRNGTIAFSFRADALTDHQWLFSKDASGNANGHMVAYLNNEGDLTIRLQDVEDSHYYTIENAVEIGQTYDFALSFGNEGMEVYLDGARVAYDKEVTVGLNSNEEALIVGANGWSNTPGETDKINSYFSGEISDVALFGRQMDGADLYGDQERANVLSLDGTCDKFEVQRDGSGALSVTDGTNTYSLDGMEYVAFKDLTFRTEDITFGTGGADSLPGGVTSDLIFGLGGNDRIDARGNDDVVQGGAGNDSIYGGSGSDKLFGDAGDDYIEGGAQGDRLYGGAGNDELKGLDGADRFYGGIGDDTIFGHSWGEEGTSGNDRVYYDGNFEDYSFETHSYFHNRRGEQVEQLIVTDDASGGLDGFYEGRDKLTDIDYLVFADQTVAVDDLL